PKDSLPQWGQWRMIVTIQGSSCSSGIGPHSLPHPSRWYHYRRGRNVRWWQVEPRLIYGQVKKSYRRRKLVRVTHVMRLGTEEALKAALQGVGFTGRLNTAFIERVNLTVRCGVAALAHPTWATAQ